MPAPLHARVELAARFDVPGWAARHAAGEVPDVTPYGLHHLRGHGIEPVLSAVALPPVPERVARSVRHRSGGLELTELLARRGRADVVLAYDERTGVPALLRPGRTPVVTGVGWLTTRADTHPVEAALARRALPRAAAVFVQCRPMLELLRSQWGVAAERTAFVRFGIDTEFYGVQPPPARPDVVFGAGEDRHRDHELLIGAVRALRERRPELRLDLATALPTSFTPDLGRLWTERLDGRIRARYAAASVVAVALHPTVTGSGLSVILEAMASGRPVVATANPGFEDYVADGRTGVLVPAGDGRALGAAIEALLADPARAAAMGAAAAADVRARHTSAAMMADIAALLHAATGPRP